MVPREEVEAIEVQRTILVVEDDPDLRAVLVDALQDRGYLVATAHDGASALALLRSIRADIIVVDLAMPGMDGLEFIERWNVEPGTGAPVVLMTGSAPLNGSDVLPAGCSHRLRKPFDLDVLCAVVATLVG